MSKKAKKPLPGAPISLKKISIAKFSKDPNEVARAILGPKMYQAWDKASKGRR